MMPRLIIALAIVGAGLSLALLSLGGADSQSEPDTDIELRINAKRLADGRTEFALQRRDDGEWSERIQPRGRYLPADADVDRWLNSTSMFIEGGGEVREVEVIREVEVEVIREVEVEVIKEVEVFVRPTLDALPEKPEGWLPLNHDRGIERIQRGRAWQIHIAANAEWTSLWQYSDSFTSDVGDFLAVQLTCNVQNNNPTWVLRLPNHIFGESDELTVEYFVGESLTYTQDFLRRAEEEQDTSWTTFEDATTVLSLIHENPPSFNSKDFSVRILGEGGVVQHQLSTYFLHRLATSSRSPDPLDNVLYCGQYGDNAEDADDSF